MSQYRENQILEELRQLRRFEGKLQASFESLGTAGPAARVSFLISLDEWKAGAQRLDALLND